MRWHASRLPPGAGSHGGSRPDSKSLLRRPACQCVGTRTERSLSKQYGHIRRRRGLHPHLQCLSSHDSHTTGSTVTKYYSILFFWKAFYNHQPLKTVPRIATLTTKSDTPGGGSTVSAGDTTESPPRLLLRGVYAGPGEHRPRQPQPSGGSDSGSLSGTVCCPAC